MVKISQLRGFAGGPCALAAVALLDCLEAGLAPAQIVAERGLAEGTIYAHLAACIHDGSAVAARIVTPAMEQIVRDVMEGDDPPVSSPSDDYFYGS